MPKPEIVERALAAIKGYAQYEYFFEHLDSPAWLKPLAEKGMFKHPQPVEKVHPYIRFPFWPESRYLVRMSTLPEVQAIVLKITLGIPSCDNSRVYDDIAEIALSLPPPLAAKLVPKLVEGIRLPIKLLLKDRMGSVIVHLTEDGQGAAAAALTGATLALSPDPRAPGEEELLRFPKPQPLLEDFYYARVVERAMPVLVSAVGFDAVQLFTGLLDDAIRLSRKPSEEEGNTEDYLYIAHPAIELGGGRDDIPGILLYAVRDAAEQLIKSDPGQFMRVLELFQQKRWSSFERLRLHLCRIFLESGGLEAVEGAFQNPEFLNRGSLQHEGVLLLKAAFSRLSVATQQHLLEWIDRGWSEASIRRWLEFCGQPVTDDAIRELSDIWKRDHYAVLEGQLPEANQQKLDELVAKMGAARNLAKPKGISGGAFGAVSPKAPEEFEQMSVAETFEFLATWTPGTNMFEATAEGAGQKLAAAVEGRLDDFVAAAGEFKRLDPTYVRSFFNAVTSALKRKRTFEWQPVLELAASVTAQNREIPGRKGGGHFVADPDWGWSRDAIIDLLETGFDDQLPGRLPYNLRTLVWIVLQPLAEDPNPAPADEIPDPESSASPVIRRLAPKDERAREPDLTSLSINTTRGRAMHAVFRYARWVRLSTDSERAERGESPAGFDEMPEVREVLDVHLDLSHEPTRTIRSVYGDHLTWLAWLDWNWLEANLGRILPMDDADYPFFRAAWSSFVVFNLPNTRLFRAMRGCYRKAIERLGKDILPRHAVKSPEDALAEHLMTYYWQDALEFGAAEPLLDDFFALASDAVRGHAMWYVGISVAEWKDEAPDEVYGKLQDLFGRRLEAARSAALPESFSVEISNFGYWFTSEKFEERWSIETLLAVLQLSKKTASEMDVVKRLSDLSLRYPVECVSCLRLMIEGDKEGWVLIGVEGDARTMLKRALDSNHPEGSASARRLVEWLIAKGQFGFRTLLP
jgi:hypothetical protein